MAPRNLAPDRNSLDDLIYEILYTLIRLRLLPTPTPQTAIFDGLHTDAKATRDEEHRLYEQEIAAEVALGWRDDGINACVRSISTTILSIAPNDRTHPLYLRYFESQAPSELMRTALGRKLAIVRGWIESLKTSPHQELSALGLVLAQRVAAADQATRALEQSRQAIEEFRLLGARRRIFERVNSERKAAYAELLKTASADEDLRQRSDEGDLFFRQLRRRDRDDSVEAARKEVEKMRKALAEAENRLKEAEERERADAAAEAQRLADKAALEAILRNVAEANRAAAQLRERLARSKRA